MSQFSGNQDEFEEITLDLKKSILDDFNTPKAFSILNKLLNNTKNNKTMPVRILMANLELVQRLLGLSFFGNKKELTDSQNLKEIEKLINQRQKERKRKNFKKADEIREYLEKIGIGIEDSQDETKWFRIEKDDC